MVFSGRSFRRGGIGRGGFVVAFGKTGHELADQLFQHQCRRGQLQAVAGLQGGRAPAQDSQAWFFAALTEIRAAQRKR